jgi:hypothetical protein
LNPSWAICCNCSDVTCPAIAKSSLIFLIVFIAVSLKVVVKQPTQFTETQGSKACNLLPTVLVIGKQFEELVKIGILF